MRDLWRERVAMGWAFLQALWCCPSVSFHQYLVFIFILVPLLPERQAGKEQGPSNKAIFFFFFFFYWRYNPWWVLVCSRIYYLYPSLSNFSFSSSLNLLLRVRAISVLVFLLVLMNMVQTRQCSFKYWDKHAKEGYSRKQHPSRDAESASASQEICHIL